MDFEYDKKYFKRHYSSIFYSDYIKIRNKFIKNEIIKFVPSGKFLEIGFGDGNLLGFFDNEFDIFGVDVSEFVVKNIKEKFESNHFKLCDVSKEHIPFSVKFDVICAINIVEHLIDPEFALKNIFYSLNKKGIFVVYLPIQTIFFSKLLYKIMYDVEEHVFRPSSDSLKKLLLRIGFNPLKEYSATFIPFKVSNKFVISLSNLYLGLFLKK
jgi:SAM-dependent methyltransferase